MPGDLIAPIAVPLSAAELVAEPPLTMADLQERLDDPAMPTFTAAELLDSGVSLIHDGVVDDEGAAFKAIAAKAKASDVLVDLSSVIIGVGGDDHLAAYLIDAKYQALGGASGILGATTTAVAATPNGAGWFREYQHGAIYFAFATGAHEVHGPILAKWRSLGGEAGFVGFPMTDQEAGDDPASRGARQRFQGATILTFPDWRKLTTVGAVVSATSPMLVADLTGAGAGGTNGGGNGGNGAPGGHGGNGGGAAIAPPATGPKTRARSRAAATDAVAADVMSATVRPATVAATAATAASLSGGTTAAVLTAADAARLGTSVSAVGGIDVSGIVLSQNATHEVHGAIRDRYDALGDEGSILGYPTTDETGTSDGVGRFNHFEAGSIYWTPATGAHEVHGLIRDLWAGGGWERGPLGYPLTDELIPDRRIGNVHPEHRRKPIVDVPFDLVKLPESAVTTGVDPSVVNTSPETMVARRIDALERTASLAAIPAVSTVTAPPAATSSTRRRSSTAAAATTAVATTVANGTFDTVLSASGLASGALTGVPVGEIIGTLDPGLISVILNGPASTPAADRSTNRFQDFENGVAFWRRGDAKASTLTPWLHADDGTTTHFVAGDVVNAAMPTIQSVFGSLPNAHLVGVTFVGMTGYAFDGAGTRNRRHRI
ncbi:MAG TPA: hypothetical protein VH440_04110, partial [Candidatus Limnocylindrales bacterium]